MDCVATFPRNSRQGVGLTIPKSPQNTIVKYKIDKNTYFIYFGTSFFAQSEKDPIMVELKDNILAYEKEQTTLEKIHMGKWVVFHNEKMIDAFDDFGEALDIAEGRYGDDPFLIREVGARPSPLPMSVSMGGNADV